MSFQGWIAAVISLANSRGIDVTTTYPGPGLVTFYWQSRSGPWHGIAGAGESMIALTTPEAFTELWQGGPGPSTPEPLELDPFLRRGRFVPRIPARAVSMALQELFS